MASDFLGPFSFVLTQENELGETLVAVMGGSTANVVTSTGASVQVDAAVLQQLGTPGGFGVEFYLAQNSSCRQCLTGN